GDRPAGGAGGSAQPSLPPVLDRFGAWRVRHAGLYTFAQSPKHVNLYAKYGFWPGPLMAVMEKRPAAPAEAPAPEVFSAVPAAARDGVLAACRQVTDAMCEGRGLASEIATALRQGFGDTR